MESDPAPILHHLTAGRVVGPGSEIVAAADDVAGSFAGSAAFSISFGNSHTGGVRLGVVAGSGVLGLHSLMIRDHSTLQRCQYYSDKVLPSRLQTYT
jgi:hypothetical protein